jgi:hypothetical protein
VLVVTHGGVLHAVHHAALGFSPQGIGYRVHNGSITVIKVEDCRQQQEQEQQHLLNGAKGTAEPAALAAVATSHAAFTETSAATAAAGLSGRAAVTTTLTPSQVPAATAAGEGFVASQGVSSIGESTDPPCASATVEAADDLHGGGHRGGIGGGLSGDDSRVGSSAAVMDGKRFVNVGGVEDDDDDEAEPEVVGECHAGCVSKGLASCTCDGAAAAPGSKGRWLEGEGSRWKMHMVVWNDPHELEAAGLLEGSGFGGGVNEA